MSAITRYLVAASILFCVPALPCGGQTIWYVHDTASGANNGQNWTDAFTNLQSALNVASAGERIWVAHGTYKPSLRSDPGDPCSVRFALAQGVRIYGGLAGNETTVTFTPPNVDNRNFQTNETILSGDLGQDGNAYVVVFASDVQIQTMLDGFTISGASSHAIWNYGSASPQLSHLLIMDCTSSGDGAGLLNQGDSQPTVKQTVKLLVVPTCTE